MKNPGDKSVRQVALGGGIGRCDHARKRRRPDTARHERGERPMKLYMHPVSTTSRPILLFIAENKIDCDLQVVDLLAGEHLQEPYARINPNRLVPVLEDGDFRLTESSAILKYLADTIDSPAYPKDLKTRARVNEVMDWFNSNFGRDYCYGLVYPQIFPNQKRASEEVQAATLTWGKEHAQTWLQVLNDHIIGPGRDWLCGDQITIADYFGSGQISLGEVIGCEYSGYPNVARWFANMKGLKSWNEVNATLYGFRDAVKGQAFVTV
jgi:glutathione S-transferase